MYRTSLHSLPPHNSHKGYHFDCTIPLLGSHVQVLFMHIWAHLHHPRTLGPLQIVPRDFDQPIWWCRQLEISSQNQRSDFQNNVPPNNTWNNKVYTLPNGYGWILYYCTSSFKWLSYILILDSIWLYIVENCRLAWVNIFVYCCSGIQKNIFCKNTS